MAAAHGGEQCCGGITMGGQQGGEVLAVREDEIHLSYSTGGRGRGAAPAAAKPAPAAPPTDVSDDDVPF